jgi:hypothetical protein
LRKESKKTHTKATYICARTRAFSIHP